jgi:hypothetical protein
LPSPLSESPAVAQAKDAITAQLTDPESVRFQDVRFFEKSETVCGFVNTKNRMGGYTGFTPFVYDVKFKSAAVINDDAKDPMWASNRWNKICPGLGKPARSIEALLTGKPK